MTNATSPSDDTILVQRADELEADQEFYGATLDGLQARIDTNIAGLENAGIDEKIAAADEEIAQMATTTLNADATDMEDLDAGLAAVDTEEDKLLDEDELSPEETIPTLTPEDTGMTE